MQKLTDNWDKFESFLSKKCFGLKTYFPEVDTLMIGLPGLVTVQGEPKACKSTFLMNILLENALHGTPVVLYDVENGLNRTRLRMLAYLSGLTTGAIKSQHLSTQEQDEYAAAIQSLHGLPIFYENIITTPEAMEESIRRIGREAGRPILVGIDSVQRLVQNNTEARSEINTWLGHLNKIKNELDQYLTIILVSEKKREAYGKASKSGGKESGTIEYLSEAVLDLYPNKEETEITVECTYNRDGDIGVMTKVQKPSPYNFRLNQSLAIPL